MRVDSIKYQTFEGNKFRLPIKNLQTKWGVKRVDCIKEYNNPRAEELYEKAQQTKDLKVKINLLSQMGDYRVIDNEVEKLVKKVLAWNLQ